MSVTKNCIHQIRTGPKKEGQYYTVQILNIKLIGEKRYRAIISDGDSFDQAFVGGPSYHYFKNNMVQEKQLIKIKDYSLTEISSGIIITLNEIEPGPPLQSTIGNPEKYVGKPVQTENNKKTASNKENFEFTSVKALNSNSREFAIKARITKKNEIKE